MTNNAKDIFLTFVIILLILFGALIAKAGDIYTAKAILILSDASQVEVTIKAPKQIVKATIKKDEERLHLNTEPLTVPVEVPEELKKLFKSQQVRSSNCQCSECTCINCACGMVQTVPSIQVQPSVQAFSQVLPNYQQVFGYSQPFVQYSQPVQPIYTEMRPQRVRYSAPMKGSRTICTSQGCFQVP